MLLSFKSIFLAICLVLAARCQLAGYERKEILKSLAGFPKCSKDCAVQNIETSSCYTPGSSEEEVAVCLCYSQSYAVSIAHCLGVACSTKDALKAYNMAAAACRHYGVAGKAGLPKPQFLKIINQGQPGEAPPRSGGSSTSVSPGRTSSPSSSTPTMSSSGATSPSGNSGSRDRISSGTLAGIIVGAVGSLAGVATFIWGIYLHRAKKRRKEAQQIDTPEMGSSYRT